MTTITLEIDPSLLRKAEAWARQHQLTLSAAISHLLQQLPEPEQPLEPETRGVSDAVPPERGKRSILELDGLGREIWRGVDAQTYVDRERDSWNG
jgi:hypothetical protein